MCELDDFVSGVIPRGIRAERAVHDGDLALRLEMWTRADPVTLVGA